MISVLPSFSLSFLLAIQIFKSDFKNTYFQIPILPLLALSLDYTRKQGLPVQGSVFQIFTTLQVFTRVFTLVS